MVTVEELLLEALEKLEHEDFMTFKWYLQLPELYSGFTPIPTFRLKEAQRRETVTVMVQKYNRQVVEVAKAVFGKMNMNELVHYLTERSSALKDVKTSAPELTEQQIIRYQQKLQSYLKARFISVQEGMAERMDEQCLRDIFIELFITAGREIHINEQHEIMWMKNQRRTAADTETPIEPSDIFKSTSGKPMRMVLTTGVAGIGKTFVVKKFVLDWTEGRENQDVHLIFPFSFSELNLMKGKKLSLAQLVHKSIWETRDIKEEDLTVIFANLQASGCRDYNVSQFKLLFVLDGLDESRLQLDLTSTEQQRADFDVTQSASVEVLLNALISGTLLPSARVWITTRPAAASQIPRDYVQRMTVVSGFTDPQKEEYFKKKFPDREQASKIICHIKSSQTLFIMCHIPVFCWLTSVVLQDILITKAKMYLPTTMTEMYSEFLMYQITQTEKRCGTKKSIQYIKSLAKLAFRQLEHGNLFYEKDLKDSGINFRKAALNTGVFTEVSKDVRIWRGHSDKDRKFSFVHLSLQEYFAALHVVMSLIKDNKNVLSETELTLDKLCTLCKRIPLTDVHEIALEKALQSSNGHLDLFLRFLLGLSLQTSQDLLRRLLKMSKEFPLTNHQHTINSIKKRISGNTSPERSINLFYCLNELKDDSLVNEVQQYMSSGNLSPSSLSPAHWPGLVFILLSSEEALDVFDLKKYCPSEEGLLRLMPVVKASNKSLLSGCNLSDNICEALASALSSQSSKPTELDLSDNDLQDSGVRLLCAGLESPHCGLQTLRLSGCMISERGCASLAAALRSNPSKLKELDLSYNHPGDSVATMLSALLKDPRWRLDTLNLDYCGEQRLRPGLKKYVCELALDENTAQRNLKLSDDGKTATAVPDKQPPRHHPERFDCWLQVLCGTGLTGRCYWEVKWTGKVYVAATYKRILRKGEGADICLGANDHSWVLLCDDDGGSYSVQHQNEAVAIRPRFSPASDRVGVFLDFAAGVLSFYKVTPDTMMLLHTFKATFDQPLYPAFGFGFRHSFRGFRSSVSLCEVEDGIFFSNC
ncbi:NACHT, LRR and PYD domains-containing protein 12 [Scophthalmus maximus]|uniref:NACHT, LRR and PYD domains-containing protein 12 n=1 Tax=Scophthalmus maximus TaxID=52904 RepID=UPI001FA8E507|nr:NACHT, LRR and PYD domains-containing protein 12 [Scophthalmus maximus]XP_047192485.1 NACHT, LRR and PYD domains-containing protein 12 [Scophthalmus maximus]